MSNAWARRSFIARQLSRPSALDFPANEASYLSQTDVLAEFASKVTSFRTRCNIDQRSIAIGTDSDFFFYDALGTLSGEFAEIGYLAWLQNKMWYELARPADTSASNKYKVLSISMIPISDHVAELANDSVNMHIINNIDLYYFERFFVQEMYDGAHGELSYVVVDQEEIESGSLEAQYDFVRIASKQSLLPHMSTLDAYMDAVKVGGIFLMNYAADYGDMYLDEKAEYANYYYDMCAHVASRTDFMTFHVPYDLGMVVCKRIAA